METIRICPKCAQPLPPNAPEGLCPPCLAKVALGSEPATPGHRVPPPVEGLAAQFPQLEIVDFIGMGGMGMVYKARQPRLDRIVALKILPVDSAKQPSFAERFSREAKALARLNHPGIVDIYDFGQTADYFYFVMEFVDGTNLRQLMNSGVVEPRQALELVAQICSALQYAHDEGIVHRDIKPENILANKKGQVKIADFGLAKLVGAAPDTALTMSQAAMGTLNYMAPEQRTDAQKVDHRADIYSLGVVFYEMLTGEAPWGRFDPPSKKAVVDVRLDEVVLRALEREPERRYQHASDLKSKVDNITATMPDGSPAPAAPVGQTVLQPKSPPQFGIYVAKTFGVFAFAWLLIAFLLRWAFSHWPSLTAFSVFDSETTSIIHWSAALLLGGLAGPFTLEWGPYILTLAFLIVVYGWFEAREKRGLKLRQLPTALRRKLLGLMWGAGAIYALLALGSLVLFFSHGAYMRHTMTREWRYRPAGGGYNTLGLRATFASFEREGDTFYEAPKACPITLIVYRESETNHPSMDVTLPSLRCEYRIPATNSWAYSSVLDKETLAGWLESGAGLDAKGSNFEAQVTDIYRLLRRYENDAPHTSDEFHNAADKELADFSFGGFTESANFDFKEGVLSGGPAGVLIVETMLYLVAAILFTRQIYGIAWSEIAAGRWVPTQTS